MVLMVLIVLIVLIAIQKLCWPKVVYLNACIVALSITIVYTINLITHLRPVYTDQKQEICGTFHLLGSSDVRRRPVKGKRPAVKGVKSIVPH